MKRAALGLLPALFACLATVGCAGEGSSSTPASAPRDERANAGQNAQPPSSSGATAPSGSAQQAIQEADIVELQDGRLYAISKAGTLSVIDVSKPGQLTLASQVFLPGQPFEMYLSGPRLVLLMNPSSLANGAASSSGAATATGSSTVLVLDVHDPVLVQRVGTFPVAGTISDSRLAGDTLYLVTEGGAGAQVTTFDLTSPASLKQVDQLSLGGGGSRSIIFGNGRMYVGGTAGIDLVDVSDPKGKLSKGTHVDTQGPITSRWQMSEKDDVLRVVSQDASTSTAVETFAVWNARSMQTMAKTPIVLPRPEELKAVRFDADRAYFITFRQTDPLFIVDLTDPMKPRQRGELVMSGWVVHLEPRGDRLVGLGVDPNDVTGKLNVSLFDVSNMDAPRMIQRVSFGQTIDLAEDQDRLQKAFRIGDDGLITVPYSGPAGQPCTAGGAVQLVKMDNDSLYRGQTLPMAGNPRRALVNQNELVAVSDSNVSAFDIASASRTADVTIGTCEVRTTSTNVTTPILNEGRQGSQWQGDEGYYYEDSAGPFGCTTTRGPSGSGWAGALGLGLALSVVLRRRASRTAA